MAEPISNVSSNLFSYKYEFAEAKNMKSLFFADPGYAQVSFKRPNSDNMEIYAIKSAPGALSRKAVGVLSLLQKYSTEDSPEITPEELWMIRDAVYKNNETILEDWERLGRNSAYAMSTPAGQTLNNFERASQHYSDSKSPDGEVINVDEIYDMAELLLTWGSFKKQSED